MEIFRMKPYPALLAELLSKELYSLRQQKSLTQEAMAERAYPAAHTAIWNAGSTLPPPRPCCFSFPCWRRMQGQSEDYLV